MKALSKVVLASLIVVLLLAPSASMSDKLPAPYQTIIAPGQTTIDYFGQQLRFTTDVPLKLNLVPLEPGRLFMKFNPLPAGGGGGNAPAAGGDHVEIYWQNWDNELYDGPAPENPWENVLLTESGFTEK